MDHAELKGAALQAVGALFSDTSVSQHRTLESLKEVATRIDDQIDAIESDIFREEDK